MRTQRMTNRAPTTAPARRRFPTASTKARSMASTSPASPWRARRSAPATCSTATGRSASTSPTTRLTGSSTPLWPRSPARRAARSPTSGRPCPALPCPALPCPALPCPALPGRWDRAASRQDPISGPPVRRQNGQALPRIGARPKGVVVPRLVSDALRADLAKVLEIEEGGKMRLLEDDVGRRTGVGGKRVPDNALKAVFQDPLAVGPPGRGALGHVASLVGSPSRQGRFGEYRASSCSRGGRRAWLR